MSRAAHLDAATKRVMALANDWEELTRYPNRTHFISAGHPDEELMVSRALAEGEAVAIIHPDGRERLIRP
ncbi:MAG TPA: hypothetical protein VMS60_09295 [Solirubrobacterales bacterium]|nr:hypothetical protein [Solirubrobacterales bacterium]